MSERSPSSHPLGAARPRILVVDDELALAETLCDGLAERGYEAVPVASGQLARKRLEDEPFAALVTDLRMPDVDGLELLAASRKTAPWRPVIVMTAYSAVESAIESIRQGAHHYLTKPFKVEELALFLQRAIDEARLRKEATALRRTLKDQSSLDNLVGRGPAMQEVADLVRRVADASVPVLILGETGTGKGLVARAIHAEGARASAPFVTVNCAAVPEALLESELFGHVRGAFTGATAHRRGLLDEANGGTLLLDEVGEMAPALQAKLLHVLERGSVRPVGSDKEREIDVRILAATHRDLRERVASGQFREDLLYRLEVVVVELPPLRSRREDLPALIEHLLARARARHPHSPVKGLSPEALQRFYDHSWGGNVRELEHVLERVVLLGKSEQVAASDLPATLGTRREAPAAFSGPVGPMRDMQRRYAAWAYTQLGGRKLMTADQLKIDVKTLGKLLQEPGDDSE